MGLSENYLDEIQLIIIDILHNDVTKVIVLGFTE